MAQVLGGDTRRGFVLAVLVYVFWGFLPLYMKLMASFPPLEILAHRVVWSVPIAGLVLLILGRWGDLRRALVTPRMLAMGFVTAALIAVNWLIYVYAILNDHALDAALGYYINPLFSIFLGAVLLGERLNRLQWGAVALVAVAVAVLTVQTGRVPLVALGLALTWGFYALAKRACRSGRTRASCLRCCC